MELRYEYGDLFIAHIIQILFRNKELLYSSAEV